MPGNATERKKAAPADPAKPRPTKPRPSTERAPKGAPAFYSRRKKRGNEICQLLIRAGDVKPEHVRRALRIQEERGGQIGRILVTMGACTERALARALAQQVQLAHASGEKPNVSKLARENPALAGLEVRCKPLVTSSILLLADLATLLVIATLTAFGDIIAAEHVSQSLLHYGFSALVLIMLVQGALGTYAATATNPPDEIRSSTLALTLIFMCDALIAMFGRELIPWHVHVMLVFEWVLCVFLLPIVRTVVRHLLARQGWWGVAVVVLGAGRTGRALVRALQTHPHLGLRPVLMLDDDVKKHGTLRASLADAGDIEVNSIRDVPMHSIARLDWPDPLLARPEPKLEKLEPRPAKHEKFERLDVGPHTPMSLVAAPRVVPPPKVEREPPYTIRSPSSMPPEAISPSVAPPDSAPLTPTGVSRFAPSALRTSEGTAGVAAMASRGPTDADAPASTDADEHTLPASPHAPTAERSVFPAAAPAPATSNVHHAPALPPPPGDIAEPVERAHAPADVAHPPLTPRVASSGSPPGSARSPSSREPMGDSLRGLVRGQFAEVEGIPVVGGIELAPLLARRLHISWAIIAMPGQTSGTLLDVTERVGGAFTRLLVIPDLIGLATMGVPSREVGGVLGLEVRQQLLLAGPRFAKRVIDLALSLLGGIFVMPLILFIGLLIKLDSKGDVFYPQKRVGRDGTPFVALKFRTMHGDGEARLRAVLDADPKLRAEYDEFHKLSRDPRVTRVGRLLRKYSLDELPQIINVLRGEMSLVGPRPYLEREIPEMTGREGIILRAMPGMTGLWQVSDRNSTGFQERLKMDVHYVRNWSPWLDLYILARTVGVVIAGTGS